MKRVNLEKGVLSAILMGALIFVNVVGCAKTDSMGQEEVEEQVEVEEQQAEQPDITEVNEQVDAAMADSSEQIVKEEEAGRTADFSSYMEGIWQRNSMGYEYNGELQPEYYVRFTAETVDYGHMKDGEFVLEFSDSIHSVEPNEAGGIKIRVENAKGDKYTYQTVEGDMTGLEYFSTWDENSFPDTYSGSSSLTIMEK